MIRNIGTRSGEGGQITLKIGEERENFSKYWDKRDTNMPLASREVEVRK